MANGKAHTNATLILASLATPAILAGYPEIPLGILLGLWLSPDLDCESDPYNRWSLLKFIWWPYQATYNHRSFWTHFPIISTAIRILYISPILYLTGALNQPFIYDHTLYLIIGLSLSDILHGIMDL